MPSYEMSVILRVMTRPETAAALKRTIQEVAKRGAIMRGIENLGERRLPYKIFKHSQSYTSGNYCVLTFDSPPDILTGLKSSLNEDVDVLHPRILRREEERGRPCQVKQCHFGELDEEKRAETILDTRKFIVKL